MVIVGDAQGEFQAVQRLYEKVHKRYPDERWVFVGDVVDRGPESKQLIAWIRRMGHDVVYGNHEDMMVDWVTNGGSWIRAAYDRGTWFMNGGQKTLLSYLPELGVPEASQATRESACTAMMDDALWLKERPTFIETDDLIITHAPINRDLVEWKSYFEDPNYRFKAIWNRRPPRPRDKFQVFGHNGTYNVFKHQKMSGLVPFAACIDNSKQGDIMAMHWPSEEMFLEAFR